MNTRRKAPVNLSNLISRLILIIYSAIVIYPMLWTLSCSLKTNEEFFDNIFGLPRVLHFENYVNAWIKANVSTYFMNSVFISVASIFLMILMASTTSFVLARYRFKLNRLVTFIYISGIMIPGMAGIIPLFLEIRAFHMLDNRAVIALLCGVGMMPMSVFLLINFFKTIPSEIEEAGVIDGCNSYQLFGKVMFPLAIPGLIPLIIIQFIWVWNEVYFSYILLSTDAKKTLQVGLINLQKVQYQRCDWVVLFAAIVIVMIPTLAVYLVFQRKIIEGVSVGALKA